MAHRGLQKSVCPHARGRACLIDSLYAALSELAT